MNWPTLRLYDVGAFSFRHLLSGELPSATLTGMPKPAPSDGGGDPRRMARGPGAKLWRVSSAAVALWVDVLALRRSASRQGRFFFFFLD